MTADLIVVVGVDGSDGSATALRWACDHADHLGAIEPVMTFVAGPLDHVSDAVGEDGTDIEPYRADAEDRLRRFLEAHAPHLVDSGVAVESRPGPGLVKAAKAAELLVVGTRGWGGRVELSVGSVGAYCARHATAPVALIPPDVPALHDHLDVVVGFDGSSHAWDALRWTLRHVRRSARVTVVRAFTDEHVAGEPLAPSTGQVEDAVRAELEAGVTALLDDLPGHPPVEMAAVPGDPRAVLQTASTDADLLVVGARGHGVLDRLLLGSVASALAHHPTVPTVVVPHRAARHQAR